MGQITRYGGPILYLFVTIFVLLALLVWADSGSRTARRLRDLQQLKKKEGKASHSKEDVFAAAEEASRSDDLLRILDVSKSYNGQKVVDDVSFSLPSDTVFALLGPNGAGKTTTFNMIRMFPVLPCSNLDLTKFLLVQVVMSFRTWAIFSSTVLQWFGIPRLLEPRSESALNLRLSTLS